MDEHAELNGVAFVWNSDKAAVNLRQHGIAFEEAIEAFFDPFLKVIDASRRSEPRDGVLGMDRRWRLLFVVHIEIGEDAIRIISARMQRLKNGELMKIEQMRERLKKDRPMRTISMRIPQDVVEDLKRVAPLRGFSGYQPLMRAYVGQGLRVDLERLDRDTMAALVDSLRRRGVSEDTISEALSEAVNG